MMLIVASVIARSEATKQSLRALFAPSGLLRCARNDGLLVNFFDMIEWR